MQPLSRDSLSCHSRTRDRGGDWPFIRLQQKMPVEINDFYLPNAPSPCLIVQTDLRGDAFLIHCTLDAREQAFWERCLCNQRQHRLKMSHAFLRRLEFFRDSYRDTQPAQLGGGFETGSGSVLLAETSPAAPARARCTDLLTFSLCLATLGFKCSSQRLVLWACHLERKFDMESDRR